MHALLYGRLIFSLAPIRSVAERSPWTLLLLTMLLGLGMYMPIASATSIHERSVEDMTLEADAVVRGHVLHTESYWDHAHIMTRVTVRTDDIWMGNVPERFDLHIPGGTLDGRRMIVHGAGTYTEGDDIIVFLIRDPQGRWIPTALTLSLYHCQDDRAVRDRDGISPTPVPSGLLRALAYRVWQDQSDAPTIRTLQERVRRAAKERR